MIRWEIFFGNVPPSVATRIINELDMSNLFSNPHLHQKFIEMLFSSFRATVGSNYYALPMSVENSAADWVHSSLASSSIDLKSSKTGLGKTHRKRDARPLSTLALSTIKGRAVAGCVMPHSVKHVRGILKLAFPATGSTKYILIIF